MLPAVEVQPGLGYDGFDPLKRQRAHIKGGGAIEVNRQPVMLAGLATQLMTVFHLRPESTVFVGGAPELEFREIAEVIDVCKGAGIRHIGLLPKEAQP